jgi:glycosyltransferase involved in cell wall biosynthesis
MNFLVLTQYFPPEIGATQERLSAFCTTLVNAGHDVEVVTAMPHHPRGRIFPGYRRRLYLREDWNGIPIHRTWVYAGNGSSLKRILSYISFVLTCLFGLSRAKRPSYVFVDSPPLLLAVAGWIAAKWHRVPLIFNIADLWPDSAVDLGLLRDGILLQAARSLEQWTYDQADYVTAITDSNRETLAHVKDVPTEKILFLPHGVDIATFRPCDADADLKRALGLSEKHVLLYAGNHGYAGAVDQILAAANHLRNDPTIHFLLLGDGPEKPKLKALAKTLALDNVTFHDAVPPAQVLSFISISDLALVTLRKAKITRGVHSAKTFVMMAAGKPIVLAGEGETERLLRKANAGVVVPPEDPRALAAAVQAVLKDQAALQTMGTNGRAFVTEHFTWPSLVQNWLEQLSCQPSVSAAPRALQLERE